MTTHLLNRIRALLKVALRKAWIWLLDHDLVRVEPWRDPRRSETDRALWRASEPKRLAGRG